MAEIKEKREEIINSQTEQNYDDDKFFKFQKARNIISLKDQLDNGQ